jgi:putative colanic acid biosynthesis acetyltransferase WcaF
VIGEQVFIYNGGHVRIGPHAIISLGACLCSATHDYTSTKMPLVNRPIDVEGGAWVCAEAFVGPGVKIGALAVLGARAVAFKDVPRGTVCVGNPCRPIKRRTLRDKEIPFEI